MAAKSKDAAARTDTSDYSNAIIPIRPEPTPLAIAVSAVLFAGVASGPALAQDRDRTMLDEVVVTATKRAESIMDVPIAITAVTGKFIQEANLNDVKDLIDFTPGVTGNSRDSFLDAVRVRGIVTDDFGNGGDPSIGMYKNGFYQGRNGSGVFSLYDIDRAEILRGPQGFLFGRNSISGAMNVHTKKPTHGQREGFLQVNVGDRNLLELEGATSFDVSDNFAVRIAGEHKEEDGYVTNIATGNKYIDLDKTAVRLTGVYDNGGNVDVMFMAEYEDRDQTGTVYRATGNAGSFALLDDLYGPLVVPQGHLQVNVDEPPNGIFDIGEILTLSMTINVDTPIGTFTSMTGFKDHDYAYTEDFDATTLKIFDYEQDQSGDYIEQEFRLVSDSDGPLSWYAGVSMYEENIESMFLGRQNEELYCNVYWGFSCQGLFDYYNIDYYGGAYAYILYDYFLSYTWEASPTGDMDDWNQTIGKFSGWAAYVDFNFQFNDAFDVNLGVRYNYDKKTFSQEQLAALNPSPVLGPKVQTGFYTPDGPLKDTQDWDDTTYRVALNYRPNDDNLLFATIATGYKQGGFNSFSITPFEGEFGAVVAYPDTHKPAYFNGEHSTSYEVGYKGTLADGRAQVALNAFYYEFDGWQSSCGIAGSPIYIVCNVGVLEGTGVEGTINFALSENWTALAGFAWFDSEANDIQEFCSAGERVYGDADACEGRPMGGAPEWSGFAALNWDYDVGNGGIFGNFSWAFESDTQTGWLALTPETTTFPEGARKIEGYEIAQMTLGYRAASSWSIALFAENLFDAKYYDGGNSGGDPTNPYVQSDVSPGRPLTGGVRFRYEFD